MRDVMLVALGGAIGATLRYLIGLGVGARFQGAFPWHTFGINIGGAFLLGLLMSVALGHGERVPVGWLLFLGTGLLGGFTTFSTLAYDSVALFQKEAWLAGTANMFGSGIAGLVSATLGIFVGRSL